MTDILQDLDLQKLQIGGQIQSQAQEERQAVETKAAETDSGLRERLSAFEQDTQAALNDARRAAAMEQRRRNLPGHQATGTNAKARISEIQRLSHEGRQRIAQARADVQRAKSIDMESVNRAEREAMQELNKLADNIKEEARQAQADYREALERTQAASRQQAEASPSGPQTTSSVGGISDVAQLRAALDAAGGPGTLAGRQIVVDFKNDVGVDYQVAIDIIEGRLPMPAGATPTTPQQPAESPETELADTWYKEHYQLQYNNGKEWVPTADWQSLNEEQKDYLNKNGVDAFNKWQQYIAAAASPRITDKASGQAYVDQLIAAGKLQKDSLFENYDSAAGAISVKQPVAYNPKTRQPIYEGPMSAMDPVAYTINERIPVYVSTTTTLIPITPRSIVPGMSASSLLNTLNALSKDPKVSLPEISRALDEWKKAASRAEINSIKAWLLEQRNPSQAGKLVAGAIPIFGTVLLWKEMSTPWKVVSIVGDILVVAPALGFIKPVSFVGKVKLLDSAKAAGKAADELEAARLSLIERGALIPSPKATTELVFAKAELQRLIQASKVADANFLTEYSKVANITRDQLKVLENKSSIKGLEEAITNVGKAQEDLNKAWEVVDETTPNTRRQLEALYGKYSAETGTLTGKSVTLAQANLNEALNNLDLTLHPVRYKLSPTAGYEELINRLETRAQDLNTTISMLEKHAKEATTTSKAQPFHDEWLAARQELDGIKTQIEDLKVAQKAGIPPPIASGYKMSWTPTEARGKGYKPLSPEALEDIRKAQAKSEADWREKSGVRPLREKPQTSKSETKAATATKEKLTETATETKGKFNLNIEPIEEPRTAPPVEKVKTPKITTKESAFPGIKTAPKPISRTESAGQPETHPGMTPEQANRLYGESISSERVVSIPIEGTGLRILSSGSVLADPSQDAQAKEALANITKDALYAATNAQNMNLTAPQMKAAVQMAVKQSIESTTEELTDAVVKEEVKNQAKEIAKVVTSVATITTLQFKEIPHIIITGPGGKKRKLTKQERAGSVQWRQGLIYKLWYPPYRQQNIKNSRRPFPGILMVSGPRSAYRTIMRLGGVLPRVISRGMGIVDITVTTPGPLSRPVISFKPGSIEKAPRLTAPVPEAIKNPPIPPEVKRAVMS